MTRAIVNCAIGGSYPTMQARLFSACAEHCPDADLQFDGLPAGCPPHDEQMYAFKILAVRKAIERGCRYVLWMDATFCPTGSLEPLWEAIERDGWYAQLQDKAKLGEWCSDAALEIFGVDREQAMRIPLIYSGLVGFDVASRSGGMLWDYWQLLYAQGAFNGAHYNKPGEPIRPLGNKTQGHVSHDPRVEGHRHDEAALSFAIWRLGLEVKPYEFTTIESPEHGFIDRNFLVAA